MICQRLIYIKVNNQSKFFFYTFLTFTFLLIGSNYFYVRKLKTEDAEKMFLIEQRTRKLIEVQHKYEGLLQNDSLRVALSSMYFRLGGDLNIIKASLSEQKRNVILRIQQGGC